jgi:hypothetical protein
VVLDRSGYVVYDRGNNEVKRSIREQTDAALDTRGGGDLTALHIDNFLDGVRGKEPLNAPIGDGHKSVQLCHLGNIAQRTGRTLRCDPASGRIADDGEAMSFWSREYEPGWEPKI